MKILAGIMYCGENEFEDCIKAIKSQTYKNYDYFIIKNKPNVIAHKELYSRFIEKSHAYDIFIKIDADMVLTKNNFFSSLTKRFADEPSLEHLEISIHDFYTDSLIPGIHIFRNNIILENTEETIFVDRVILKKNYKYDNYMLSPAAQHSPNPSDLQSFHFGIHKAIKALQMFNKKSSATKTIRHFRNIRKLKNNFIRTKDQRLKIALIGAEMALHYCYSPDILNYNNSRLKKLFHEILQKSDASKNNLLFRLRLKNGSFLPLFFQIIFLKIKHSKNVNMGNA